MNKRPITIPLNMTSCITNIIMKIFLTEKGMQTDSAKHYAVY